MKVVLDIIPEDFVQVVGIADGIKKDTKQPYYFLTVVSASSSDSFKGFNASTIFSNDNDRDYLKSLNIEIGDFICPFYVGVGAYKKIKSVDIIKSETGEIKKNGK